MTDLPQWAKDKAREWLESLGGRLEGPGPIGEAYGWLEVSDENAASLAALLVEVSERSITMAQLAQLAEVRRVVEEVSLAEGDGQGPVDGALSLILAWLDLSRLEKL